MCYKDDRQQQTGDAEESSEHDTWRWNSVSHKALKQFLMKTFGWYLLQAENMRRRNETIAPRIKDKMRGQRVFPSR